MFNRNRGFNIINVYFSYKILEVGCPGLPGGGSVPETLRDSGAFSFSVPLVLKGLPSSL